MKLPSFAFLNACALLSLAAACGGGDDGGSTQGNGGAGASTSNAGGGGNGNTGGGGSGNTGGGGSGGGGTGECGGIATFADGLVPAQELHVATNGSDGSGDGSAQSPFATIEHAASLATPGTAIRVHAGTYAGGAYIDDLAGADGAPIWIGGAPGEARPVFDGGGEAMHLSRARYVVVHDLEVRNMTANGINCDDGGDVGNPDASHHIVFRNLFIHTIGSGGNQDCLKLSGINDYFVLDSEMTVCGGNGSGSAIDHVGCHRGVIARNHIHDLTGNGIQCKGGSEDIDIRWNRLIEAGFRAVNMGGSTGFEFFRPPLSMSSPNAEARDIRVLANVIVGGDASAAFVGCVDCEFAANTVVNPHNWFFRILQETVSGGGYTFLPASNGVVRSNLLYFARGDLSGEDINIGGNTDPGSFTLDSNLWYAHDNPGASAPATPPVTETGAVIGEDPGLADPAGGDYHIGPMSPAAGRGVAVAGLAGDMDGACYGMPPSIGAYEVK
jgi:hypothetical protein